MDFKLPLDQLIEKTNQLIEKTEDLIKFYYDFCDYQQLPLKLKRELKEWPSKYRRNRQKFKEFTVEWNNFIGFDDTPTYGILDEEIVSILQHRLEKLKFYEGILKLKAKKKLKSSQMCNLQPSSSLDDDPVKSNLEPASQTCLKESENHDATQPVNLQTETGSLDNDVTDLEPAGKDKCETVWCRDWDKNHNEGYKTFQDKVSNYMTWKFRACDIQIQAKRSVTMDLIFFFLIMMGRWMKHKNVNERWDTQSQSQDTSYLNWDIGLECGRELFGFLKFKFKFNLKHANHAWN